LIITDDLMMNGATMSAGSLSRAAKQALLAGNDIVMLSKTPLLDDPVWTYLLTSMRQEPAFRERVRDAAYRVLAAKLEWLRRENTAPFVPDLRRVDEELPSVEGAAFFLDLAARSVTVVRGGEADGAGRGSAPVIPLLPDDAGRVLLAGQFEEFFAAGRAAYPGAMAYWYSLARGADDLAWAVRQVDTVIFCISDPVGVSLVRTLRNMGKRVILFSVLSPVYLDAAPWAEGAIAVYSYARESFIAGFSVLAGRIPAQGRLPFPAAVAPR
jgi:beta-N-acetylhexosaminidase